MQTFTHGQQVTCTIDGTDITDAKISINSGGSPFICQNLVDGSNAEDKLGYRYSWWLEADFTYHGVTNLKSASPKTLDDIQAGDMIVNSNGNERPILMRIGDVVVFGFKEYYGYKASINFTIAELKDRKFTVKQDEVTTPAPTKLTVAQIAEKLGYEVEVIKG